MKSNALRIRQMVLVALFSAIEIILSLTPLGYIPIGPIRATTLHIPVILTGILLGKRSGAAVGFVFGFTSLMINTFQPTITSFVFSPFISIGGSEGNLASLWIVFGPRILLGWLSGAFYDGLSRLKVNQGLAVILTSVLNTLCHTLLVMGSIALFFGPAYAAARGILYTQLLSVILGVITSNGILEAILAGILCAAIVRALSPVLKERSSHAK